MAVIQRLLYLSLIPIIAIVALQIIFPDAFRAFQDVVQPYISRTRLSQVFPGSTLSRSETPLIIASVTHWSHFEKIAAIAMELATLGYPITFMTGRIFETATNKLHPNIKFQAFQGLDDKLTEEDAKIWKSLEGYEQEIFIMKKVLVDGMPDQHDSFQLAFRQQREKYGDSKPIIFLFDQSASGVFPVQFGVPGIRADTEIGISLAPLAVESNDTYPFRSGKVPETGPDARAKHQAAYEEVKKNMFNRDINEYWWAKLREMGATRKEFPQIIEGMNTEPEYLLTMGIPEFEFSRSDLRPNVRWYGAFKKVGKVEEGDLDLPEWWNEIDEAKKAGKKIVAVSQGTVETDLSQIVMPTIEGLKESDDVLIVASTVVVELGDVEGLFPVPQNTRVAKFVPYDLLLPKVDLLVSNGGFGAVQHCLRLGIPMVVSGVGQDKPTTNSLVQYSGVGIDLGERSPSAEKIRDAVVKVLTSDSFKARGKALSKQYPKYDVGKVFDQTIQEAIAKWNAKKTDRDEL